MIGNPPLLSMLVAALVMVPLGLLLRRWYAKDQLRSLFVLCLMLLFVSPWLALAALAGAKLPGILVQRAQRIEGN